MTPTLIRPDMTMEEILRVAPAAQRALFQRYHVGGCSSCGFQPTDTLAQLCKERNILDVNEVIRTIQVAQEMDAHMQLAPAELRAWLARGETVTFLDVRPPDESTRQPIAEAEPLDYEDSGRYMGLPKDQKIVFACQDGSRALDVAAYFKGHGFTQVYSLRGGFDAWAVQPTPTLETAPTLETTPSRRKA